MGPAYGLAFAADVWIIPRMEGGWRRAEWLRLVATESMPFAGHADLLLIRRKAEALALAQAGTR